MARTYIVHPVAGGAFLEGIPAAPISTDAVTAQRLIETGAFAKDPADPTAEQPDPVELSEDQITRLDFYNTPEAILEVNPLDDKPAVPAGVDETVAAEPPA